MEFFLLIVWTAVIGSYNYYLKTKCGYSAFIFGRIAAAFFCCFLWLGVFTANEFSFAIVLALIGAILLTISLLALNYQTSENVLHAILMTLFQLTWGFLIVVVVASLLTGGGKKKKR